MSNSLSTIGGIAEFIYNSFTNLPSNISGNVLLQITDTARQHVSNYAGVSIGSNAISDEYQPAIIDFTKADVVNLLTLDASTNSLDISDLSIGKTDSALSAEQYRMLGEMKLRALGRKIQYAKSIS
jgi:hypothetical protein